jgi:hypothetical protein
MFTLRFEKLYISKRPGRAVLKIYTAYRARSIHFQSQGDHVVHAFLDFRKFFRVSAVVHDGFVKIAVADVT